MAVGQPRVNQEQLQNQYMRQEAGPLATGLNNLPRESGVVGAMMWRGTNTITRGGFAPNTVSPHNMQKWTGFMKEGFRQRTGRPMAHVMYANQDIFHGTGRAGFVGKFGASTQSRSYTPFMASTVANSAGRMLSGDATIGAGMSQRIANSAPGQALRSKGWVQPGGELVSRGFTTRVAAAARTSNMSQAAFAKRAGNVQNFLRGSYAGSSSIGEVASQRAVQGAKGFSGGSTTSAQALLMSGQGSLSQRWGGYMAGTVKGTTGTKILPGARPFADEGAQAAFSRARTDVARLGLQNRSSWGVGAAARGAVRSKSLRGLKSGAKVIGARGAMSASRFAGPLGAGLFSMDMTELAVKSMGSMARDASDFAMDLNDSYHGGMEGRVLEGGGFQDNRASLSSRQRGVAAIQNSRLNSRSVLGSEAGMMSSHFGR